MLSNSIVSSLECYSFGRKQLGGWERDVHKTKQKSSHEKKRNWMLTMSLVCTVRRNSIRRVVVVVYFFLLFNSIWIKVYNVELKQYTRRTDMDYVNYDWRDNSLISIFRYTDINTIKWFRDCFQNALFCG